MISELQWTNISTYRIERPDTDTWIFGSVPMMEVAYQTNGEGWAIQYVVALALFWGVELELDLIPLT